MLSYIDKLLNKRGDYLFLQEVTQMSQDRSGIARVTHLMEFVLSNPGHVPLQTFLNETIDSFSNQNYWEFQWNNAKQWLAF